MDMKVRQIQDQERESVTFHASFQRYPFGFYYMHRDHWNDMLVEWCVDQFGNPSQPSRAGRFATRLGPVLRYVFFRDQVDATAFKVRWM